MVVTDKEGMIATLHWLYIDNHPDRMGFGGTTPELLAWAVRMGLLMPEEVVTLA